MTPEQLDEIEKEAKDGGPEDDGAGDIAAFLVDCRILPLVKALREARAALDQVSSDDRMSEAQITAAITEAAKERDEALESLRVARSDVACLWEERDEARAEVERLREALQEIAEGDCHYADNCPPNAGTRHGTCTKCKARQALKEGES